MWGHFQCLHSEISWHYSFLQPISKKTWTIPSTKHSTANNITFNISFYLKITLRQARTERRERLFPECLVDARHFRSRHFSNTFWGRCHWPCPQVRVSQGPGRLSHWCRVTQLGSVRAGTQTPDLSDSKTPVSFPALPFCFQFSTPLWSRQGKDCYSHSTEKLPEVQKGKTTCLRSHKQLISSRNE